MKRRLALAAVAALAFTASADSSPVTFPGKNGLIAFTRQGPPCAIFQSAVQCAEAIWVSAVDGTKLRRLTKPKRKTDAHRHAIWSPDGRRIAYVANSSLLRYSELWVVNADGTGNRKVLDARRGGHDLDRRPSWSPTGTELFYEKGNALYAVNVTSGKLRRVAGGLPSTAYNLQVSPNGKLLAYIAGESNSIWVNPLNGSSRRRLAPVFGGQAFDWSPDSSRIVYLADFSQLATVSVRGGSRTTVVSRTDEGISWGPPVWSPDGTTILFSRSYRPSGLPVSAESLRDRFSTVRTDGSDLKLVGPGSGGCDVFDYNPETRKRTQVSCRVDYPSWQPRR